MDKIKIAKRVASQQCEKYRRGRRCKNTADYALIREEGDTVYLCSGCLPKNVKILYAEEINNELRNSKSLVDGRQPGFPTFREFGKKIKPSDYSKLIIDEQIEYEFYHALFVEGEKIKIIGMYGKEYTAVDTIHGRIMMRGDIITIWNGTSSKKLSPPRYNEARDFFWSIPKVFAIDFVENSGREYTFVLKMDGKKYKIIYDGRDFIHDDFPWCIDVDEIKYKVKRMYLSFFNTGG